MTARLRKFLSDLKETFWLVPGLMVVVGVLGGVGLVSLDRAGAVPDWFQHTVNRRLLVRLAPKASGGEDYSLAPSQFGFEGTFRPCRL